MRCEVLYIFAPNRYYAYLLNVERRSLVFLKTYNTEFDEITIIFMDQNGRPVDKVNLRLIINKLKWYFFLWNQERGNTLKDFRFCHSKNTI